LTPELEKHYEDQFDLFTHPGWKDLLEDFEKIKKQVEDIATVADAQTLHNRQGQLAILNLILNRKEMYEAAYKDLQEGDS